MKKWKTILVMLLVLLVPCQAAWAVGDNLVPTGNLQLMFAQLQQEQAEINGLSKVNIIFLLKN